MAVKGKQTHTDQAVEAMYAAWKEEAKRIEERARRSEFELEQTLEVWRLAEKLNAVIRTVTFPKQLRALVIRTLSERRSTAYDNSWEDQDDEQPRESIERDPT